MIEICKVRLTRSVFCDRMRCKVNIASREVYVKNRVRQLREAFDMTQEQLGEFVGTSRQAINAIETEKNEPSIWLAYDIAKVFHEPIENVFLFEESERKSRADISRGCARGPKND